MNSEFNGIVKVIGGGLAGCEAAWQLAKRGFQVELWEMRPDCMTPAHNGGDLAELVCSNSLGSKLEDRATGVLQYELRTLDSLIMIAAERSAVPAGGALAVDRLEFSRQVTDLLVSLSNLKIVRKQATEIPEGPCVIATGPLTSEVMTQRLIELVGEHSLFFFDAIAPIVEADSLDYSICFTASRYDRGEVEEGDYINCPMNKEEYLNFVRELHNAEKIPLRDFEAGDKRFFEMCLPVEELARRGERTLAFGPLRPKGLTDPRTGKMPYAVVQLRRDNLAGSLFNMVGFQTNLKYAEQKRVFQMIPGLADANFVRFGQMHRNTFLCAPQILGANLQVKNYKHIFMAGQLIGSEGYLGNVGTGLLAGINLAAELRKTSPMILPRETMLGAIVNYITSCEPKSFQPMKANMGILPELPVPIKGKRPKAAAYAARAKSVVNEFLSQFTVD